MDCTLFVTRWSYKSIIGTTVWHQHALMITSHTARSSILSIKSYFPAISFHIFNKPPRLGKHHENAGLRKWKGKQLRCSHINSVRVPFQYVFQIIETDLYYSLTQNCIAKEVVFLSVYFIINLASLHLLFLFWTWIVETDVELPSEISHRIRSIFIHTI